jgi:hypothetical protein
VALNVSLQANDAGKGRKQAERKSFLPGRGTGGLRSANLLDQLLNFVRHWDLFYNDSVVRHRHLPRVRSGHQGGCAPALKVCFSLYVHGFLLVLVIQGVLFSQPVSLSSNACFALYALLAADIKCASGFHLGLHNAVDLHFLDNHLFVRRVDWHFNGHRDLAAGRCHMR